MFFREKRPPSPLSDLCSKCSQEFIVNFIQTGDPENEQKRAQLLSYLIMHGAYDFINCSLNPERSEIWSNSHSVVTNRNKDVLTAETAMLLCFLIGLLLKNDKDYDKYDLVGYLTLRDVNILLVSLISELTKVDFSARALEIRRLYLATEKARGRIQEVFANRLLACLANKSLADSPTESPAISLTLDPPIRLHLAVAIFFSAGKPLARISHRPGRRLTS
jgi:hypothetical protein